MEPKANAISAPRLIPAYTAGFNAVANNIYVIVFPVLLDIFLWFGPRLRVQDLFTPFINEMVSMMTQMDSPQIKDYIGPVKETWVAILKHFNLFSLLRTFPIGVPSLLASAGTLETPLGSATIIETPTLTIFSLSVLALIVLGILAGSLYFYQVARISAPKKLEFSVQFAIKQWGQMVALTFLLILGVMILAFPFSLILSLLSMISSMLAQIIFVIIIFFLLWFLVPLMFSTHGVYAFQQNLFVSTLNSIRLVRFFLPGAGFFILTAVFANEGLGAIWRIAPETSWMTMIGILGHAFVATSLLTSSFIYYRSGVQWMEENLRRLATSQEKNTPGPADEKQ